MRVVMRGGSGLGDSIYLRPVADHLIATGKQVTVRSNYPDIFRGSVATVIPFDRKPVNVLAHYAVHRARQETNQFQDVCDMARIPRIPLAFEWSIRNQELVERVRENAAGRKIIIVHGGRAPFARTDGLGKEIMPKREAFEAALSALDCYTVRIGNGKHFYDLPTDLDLVDRTSVSDLIDLAKICDGVITQCGFPIPLAECFDKPVLAIFGAGGLVSRHPVVKLVTPAKILCKSSSDYAVDDWFEERIKDKARESLGVD